MGQQKKRNEIMFELLNFQTVTMETEQYVHCSHMKERATKTRWFHFGECYEENPITTNPFSKKNEVKMAVCLCAASKILTETLNKKPKPFLQ